MASLNEARKKINEIDKEMAELFVKRMAAVAKVAEYKSENGLPIFDAAREDELIKRNAEMIESDELRAYYVDFLKNNMAVSKAYQSSLIKTAEDSDTRKIHLTLPNGGYDITVGHGFISRADEFMALDRRVFILTDDGVPSEYAEAVAKRCREARIYTVKSGEGSKSLGVMQEVLVAMMDYGMTRTDCVVAVGGGVVGDLAGFVAASYMRGVDFYNIPTTMLAQVDSSIGGKTAVNLGSVKNIVGAFYQPKGVLIDTDVLKTLSKRHLAAGLAEAVKMSLTSDAELFSLFENGEINEENIEYVIARALDIKRKVVEADEKESGLRKILNFGHTLGHGIEAEEGLGGLYHGECVALGMLPFAGDEVRARLVAVLKKLGLPTEYRGNLDVAIELVAHDKKCEGGSVSAIFVDEVGKARIEKLTLDEFKNLVKERF